MAKGNGQAGASSRCGERAVNARDLPWVTRGEDVTEERIAVLCEALAETASVEVACERTRVVHEAVRAFLARRIDQHDRVRIALQRGGAMLARRVFDRAVNGQPEPMCIKGKPVFGWWSRGLGQFVEVEDEAAARADPDLERRMVQRYTYDAGLFRRLVERRVPTLRPDAHPAGPLAPAVGVEEADDPDRPALLAEPDTPDILPSVDAFIALARKTLKPQ